LHFSSPHKSSHSQPRSIRFWNDGELSEATFLLRRPQLYDLQTNTTAVGPLTAKPGQTQPGRSGTPQPASP